MSADAQPAEVTEAERLGTWLVTHAEVTFPWPGELDQLMADDLAAAILSSDWLAARLAAERERIAGDLVDITDERNVLSGRLGAWESLVQDHTRHDNCADSDACYEWGFAHGWKSAMAAYLCWCGSPVGPRVPGVGCLADITHDWTGARIGRGLAEGASS